VFCDQRLPIERQQRWTASATKCHALTSCRHDKHDKASCTRSLSLLGLGNRLIPILSWLFPTFGPTTSPYFREWCHGPVVSMISCGLWRCHPVALSGNSGESALWTERDKVTVFPSGSATFPRGVSGLSQCSDNFPNRRSLCTDTVLLFA
jgi:hypothetical protein